MDINHIVKELEKLYEERKALDRRIANLEELRRHYYDGGGDEAA